MDINNINKKLCSIFNRKDIPLEFRVFIKLTVIGMIMYYGEEYTDLILDTIDNIDFFYGIDKLKDSTFDIKQVEAWINSSEPAFTLSSFSIFNKRNKSIPDIKVRYGICIRNTKHIDNLMFLEYIVHEINHIVCSQNNSFFKDINDNIGYRTGFYTAYFRTNKRNNGKGRIFNEVINSLMTEDIINIILNIQDDKLYNLVSSMKNTTIDGQYYVQGYSGLTNLFRTIFNVTEFKEFCKTCLINGNVEDMDNLFNDVLGKNKYDELLEKLDIYYKDYLHICNSKRYTNVQDVSIQYMDIKNNYVRLFLERKYNKELTFK